MIKREIYEVLGINVTFINKSKQTYASINTVYKAGKCESKDLNSSPDLPMNYKKPWESLVSPSLSFCKGNNSDVIEDSCGGQH